ncbi:MAG: PQQ-binding-like beta-propeller repeat protein, partial [Spirochaetota bacterium]
GALHAIAATSGEILWSHGPTGSLAAGPALDAGRVATVTIDGEVTIYGAEGFLSKWNLDEWDLDAEAVLVAPIWHDGRLLVVDGAGTVFCLTESGELLWQYELRAHLAGIPVRVGDALLLGEAGGGLVSVDLRSGTEIGRVSFGSQLKGEAALYDDSLWWALGDGSVREIGFDGEHRETPLLTAEGSWVLPETGTFRLEDERVSLTMRSGRDAVFEITVTSAPSEDLVLRVVSAEGAEVATNMGKVTLSRTVRAALDAGVTYELVISRPNPRGEITVSVQTRQLQ